MTQTEHQYLSSWLVSFYGSVWSFLSLLVAKGYSDWPNFALTYIQSSHPCQIYFQLGFSNQWQWDSSYCLYFCSSGLVMDAASNTSPLYGHQCCSSCCDYYTGVLWLSSSYLFPFFSSSYPPYRCLVVPSTSIHLIAQSLGLCSPGIVPIHKPHPLIWAWATLLAPIDGGVDPQNTWGVYLGPLGRYPALWPFFLNFVAYSCMPCPDFFLK